jgi:glycosyltransferase
VKVLLQVTPVPSHLMPLVPLAWGLRAAGHELLVAGQPDIVYAARRAGLSAVALGDPFHVDDLLFEGLPDGVRPIEVRPRPPAGTFGHYGRVWMTHAKYLLPRYLAFATEYAPDLIVADPLDYGSLVVGGVLGVPVVHHRWGVDAISGPARAAMRPAFAGICRRLGLDGLPDPTVLLDPCPPTLQLPDVEPGTPIRYVPFNGAGRREPVPGGEARRIVVTLGGTLALNGAALAGRILRAAAGIADTHVVATIEERYRSSLGPLPANVTLIEPTPLDLFLGAGDTVVHHGGAGTTLTATAYGLPQLVLPQLADHFAHGDRIAATGAGIALDTAVAQDDSAALRDGLAALLDEPHYREVALALAEELRKQPAPTAVADDLATLAADTRRGRTRG